MNRQLSTVLLLALCTLLQACGGGGGAGGGGAAGGGTGGGAGGGGAGGGGTTSLYGGLETQATLSPTNAARFVEVVFDSSALGDGFVAIASTGSTAPKSRRVVPDTLTNLPGLAQRIHHRAVTSAMGLLEPEGSGFQIAVRVD
jgi:hypothetical protein